MVHFDAFWNTFYTNCSLIVTMIMNSNILKLHMLNSAAKRQT